MRRKLKAARLCAPSQAKAIISLGKTITIICIAVIGAVFALVAAHQRGARAPIEDLAALQSSRETLTGAAVAATSSVTAATSPSSASAAMALANDPRHVSPPVALGDAAHVDAETTKRYSAALEDFELDGCNANGTLAIMMRNERRPRIVRNGQTIEFPNGLNLTVRQKGYPACRVVLYDGKIAVGEVAGF